MSPIAARLTLVCGILNLSFFAGCGAPVKPPTSYVKHSPKEAIFHCELPEGWTNTGGGKKSTSYQWVRSTKGGVMIHGVTDVSSSVVGDIATSFNNLGGGDEGLTQEQMDERAPVNTVHKMNLKKVNPDDYGSYKEIGDPIKFTSPLSEGRKSVFTARVGAARKVKGYRATLLAQNNGVTFYCYCSEKDFEKFQEAFDKVLESVSHAN
ncbi:MAG: hypothetical protein L0211_14000 [Planctomycetaceae bacterium]|nr:hypothetical protein [Planctomycetaceae bacterium]